MSERPNVVQAVRTITTQSVLSGKIEFEEVLIPVMNDDGSLVTKDGAAPKDDHSNVVMRKAKAAKQADLFVVYGRATEHRNSRPGVNGESSMIFVGNFEAKRLSDGMTFSSTEVIFPSVAQDLAVNAYSRVKAQDENAAVNFGFIVGVDADPKGLTGYKWTIKHQSAVRDETDPLAEIRSSLAMDFAGVLGEETMLKIGMMPGAEAKQIEAPKKDKTA